MKRKVFSCGLRFASKSPNLYYENDFLKCNDSNSIVAVHSGFDLHRFLQVLSQFGKKDSKTLPVPGFEPESS